MDREILFRGICTETGDWVNGFYVRLNGEEHRIYNGYAENDCGDYYPDFEQVAPETVGQFTGLTDKNGKKIFEGDILDYWSNYSETLCGSYETVVFGVNNCSCCHAVYGWSTKNEYGYGRYIETPEECVVVGNIWDNPELLEGGVE